MPHALVALCLLGVLSIARAQDGEKDDADPLDGPAWYPESPDSIGLTLEEFRQRILDYNEAIQMQLLGVLITERNYKAAKGVFEPQYVGSLEYVDNLRPNTAEERRNQGGVDIFDEENILSTNGLEFLLPSNAQFRLGMNIFELQNNLQGREPRELSTFLGASVTQPLLRNAGKTASLANIRLAAMESELAFQEYRRQIMVTVAAAEAAYWNVFYAYQEMIFSEESLEMARAIYEDVKTALDAGKATQAEVMEARVNVLSREALLSGTQQQLYESINLLITYYSGEPLRSDENVLITQAPPPPPPSPRDDREEVYTIAFQSNPDYLRRLKQVEMENLRIAYAKNQDRPQLDLKGSYGLNGLGGDFESSRRDITGSEFPAWSVGVEMRIPLGGGITTKNQLDAAKARKIQALLGLKQVEVQLNSAVDNALRKLGSTLKSFQANQATVVLNDSLLKDARESLLAGRIDLRRVFEVEQDLFESKNTAIRNIVEYQNAQLETELVAGSILANRGWEVTRFELKSKTEALLAEGGEDQETHETTDPIDHFSAPALGTGTAGKDVRAADEPASQRQPRSLFGKWFSKKYKRRSD